MKTTKNVKIQFDIMHYLPFSCTNKRVRGWEMVKDWGDYKIICRAWETITDADVFIMIAAVKAFQDSNKGDIEHGQMIHDRPTIALKINVHTFMNGYLSQHNREYLMQSLRRLSSMQAIEIDKDGERENRYLLGYDLTRNVLTLILNKKWYDACVRRGWTLKFDFVRQFQKTARALYLYLSAQRNTAFYQATLETALGLESREDNNRAAIRKAFEELKELGAIQGYEAKKNLKGWIFTYEK